LAIATGPAEAVINRLIGGSGPDLVIIHIGKPGVVNAFAAPRLNRCAIFKPLEFSLPAQ
jgi:hypothetical protein